MLLQMKSSLPAVTAGLVFLFAGCSEDNPTDPGNDELTFTYNFQSSAEGFEGGFADYPDSTDEDMELLFLRSSLPSSLDPNKYGLFLTGRNSSDDLFMYVKKRLTALDGIEADVVYQVSMTIRIATPEASACIGAGGAPGEAQHMKAGVTVEEPEPFVNQSGFFEMNIDKGQQISSGADMRVIGHVGNNSGDCSGQTWEYKTLTLSNFAVKSDQSRTLWLIAGTDSGYEGVNQYYFTDFTVTVQPTGLDSLP